MLNTRTVAEIAYLEDGRVRTGGRVDLTHQALERFGRSLRATDHAVLEATGNTAAIVAALKPYVARVVIANPLQVRLIAEAHVKTDKIDAAVLAQLYASGFLPQVWIADERTQALRRQVARRAQIVLTITGVNATVAIGLLAAIGEIARFPSPQKLVSYFGLNPRVRQSGLQPAQHGHISKIGRSHARAMLVEAAWAAAKAPGPLRSFFLRIRARRGMQIAVVATARKLATIVWYVLTDQEDYTWARPSLVAMKERALQLQEYFQKFEPNTVGDMLKRVPGVGFVGSDIMEYDGPQLRGLGGGYTQVLINGKKVPGAGDDRSFWVDRIPAEMVERVEILRSNSANRSGDAVGGAINIILRDSYSFDGTYLRAGVNRWDDGESNPTFGAVTSGDFAGGRILAGVNI